MRLGRSTKLLLALLAATFALNIAVTPGFGIETRSADAFAPALVAAFAFVGLAPVALALALLKWPRPAAWGVIAVSGAAVLLNVADFAGLWTDATPTAVVRAFETAVVALAVAQIAIARNVLREDEGATMRDVSAHGQ